jgi:hypothetical protein
MGTAPVAGGALLAIAAGRFAGAGPDQRAQIKQDLDILDRLPPELEDRRAVIVEAVAVRLDYMISAGEKTRDLWETARSYRGNWRDVVLVGCVVLFAFIWWQVDHSKPNWLPTFVVLILLGVLTTLYAVRGVVRGIRDAAASRSKRTT